MNTSPKKYFLRFAVKNRQIFNDLLLGTKKIETRAASVRYRGIKKGDIVILWCGSERIPREVIKSRIFKSVPALLRVYKASDILPGATKADLAALYVSFPGYALKVKKYGLIALEFAPF